MVTTRSVEELRKVSEHLYYELWMLLSVTRALSYGMFGPGSITNALVESFTIHFRVLYDFFWQQTKSHKDDVLLCDFIPTASEFPSPPSFLKTLYTRVNKQAAHLTFTRLDYPDDEKGWPFLSVWQAMHSVVTVFYSKVDKHLLCPKWHEEREAIGIDAPNTAEGRPTSRCS